MATSTSTSSLAVDFALAITRMRARLRREQADRSTYTMSQMTVLGRISEEQPTTSTAVAAAEHIRQQSVAETVSSLRNQGLVSTEPDPADRRKLLLSLTPKGTEFIASVQASRGAWLERAIDSQLSPDEQEILAQAVALMARLADSPDPRKG
ncbi:MarR family transcriptional regulator [Streptomyces sp. NPDC050625]|uniref:MarR family winged helix-turn-helix transcriptional regulator n=1 Tax=Streptomyces sp. NPDC050625 TaxID=3154629 RepID=UPI0034134054